MAPIHWRKLSVYIVAIVTSSGLLIKSYILLGTNPLKVRS